MAPVQNQKLIADPLYELLLPHLNTHSTQKLLSAEDPSIDAYLNHLTTLSFTALTTSEPQALYETEDFLRLSLQSLSRRSHQSMISSCAHLSNLGTELPLIANLTTSLRDSLPQLDEAATYFSETYNTRSKNLILDRRRTASTVLHNIDRVCSILELPTLLSSAIQSSNQFSSSTLSYASALDLNAHIRRLHSLHPDSSIIQSVVVQSEEAMSAMTTNLILSLKMNSLKLASAIRIISWLRRVSPELDPSIDKEGVLGSLFLVCRLANLQQMLGALEPLRELADQEKILLEKGTDTKSKLEIGLQTERYLKRYIEIFREQSFAIINMYRSIFSPSTSDEVMTLRESSRFENSGENSNSSNSVSSVLALFPLHLVGMFTETLKIYLPNVTERISRDSLLTQVLYCAGSLGRLGSDFSMILSFFDQQTSEDGKDDEEWAEIIKKHRMLAGKLELMVGNREN